jgi:microcin C transport system permease protein
VLASPGRRAPARLAAVQAQPPGVLEPGDLCVLVVLEPVCRAGLQRPPLDGALRGQTYFPMLKDYPEKTFGGDFDTTTDYLDPFIRERLRQGGNWALFAPNPYGPKR